MGNSGKITGSARALPFSAEVHFDEDSIRGDDGRMSTSTSGWRSQYWFDRLEKLALAPRIRQKVPPSIIPLV